MVSETVAGSRCVTSCITGAPEKIEVPNCPRSMFHAQIPNCTGSGSSRPKLMADHGRSAPVWHCRPRGSPPGLPGARCSSRNTMTPTDSPSRPASRSSAADDVSRPSAAAQVLRDIPERDHVRDWSGSHRCSCASPRAGSKTQHHHQHEVHARGLHLLRDRLLSCTDPASAHLRAQSS